MAPHQHPLSISVATAADLVSALNHAHTLIEKLGKKVPVIGTQLRESSALTSLSQLKKEVNTGQRNDQTVALVNEDISALFEQVADVPGPVSESWITALTGATMVVWVLQPKLVESQLAITLANLRAVDARMVAILAHAELRSVPMSRSAPTPLTNTFGDWLTQLWRGAGGAGYGTLGWAIGWFWLMGVCIAVFSPDTVLTDNAVLRGYESALSGLSNPKGILDTHAWFPEVIKLHRATGFLVFPLYLFLFWKLVHEPVFTNLFFRRVRPGGLEKILLLVRAAFFLLLAYTLLFPLDGATFPHAPYETRWHLALWSGIWPFGITAFFVCAGLVSLKRIF